MKKDDSLMGQQKQQKAFSDPNQSDKTLNFWFCAGLLAILLASILSRDITRPFCGLHSWADAHGPWAARVHLKYGLTYTKGFSTRAVGYPPVEKPFRYLDHPQLPINPKPTKRKLYIIVIILFAFVFSLLGFLVFELLDSFSP